MVFHAMQYLAVRALLGAMTLAATMVFSHLVPPEAWGRYTLVVAAATALSAGLFGWMGVALVREHATDDAMGKRRLTAQPALFLAATMVAALLAVAVAASGQAPPHLVALGLALTLALAGFDLSLNLSQARHHIGRFAGKSLLRGAAALGLGTVAAWVGGGETALLLAAIASLLLCLGLFGRADWRDLRPRRLAPGAAAALFSFGWPIALGIGLSWMLDVADRFLVAHLLGEEAAGRYAMGYDLARYPLWMVISASALAALPAASRAFDAGGAAAARPVLAANLVTLLMVGLPLLAVESLFPHTLSGLILGEDYAGTAAAIMPLVAAGVMLQGIRAFLLDVTIHLSRRTRPLFFMLLWAVAANLGLNLVLIPSHGLEGAALATLLAHGVALAYWALFVRHYSMLALDLPQLGRLALALAVFLALAVPAWTPTGEAWFVARMVVAGLAYLAALAALDVNGLGGELRRRLTSAPTKEVP